jgi:hypothetical protein
MLGLWWGPGKDKFHPNTQETPLFLDDRTGI